MTKADLVAEIVRKTGLEREEVGRVVEAVMDTIKSSLQEGNHYELRGFGTFQVRKRASKVARNIAKNESMVIPERLVPVFKPSKKFTDLFLENNKKRKK
ncbi:putative DNA-binding protein HU [Bacteroidales bacterium KA00251]|nr:putative DNA-binding protein HU [Bacteroidales bacterium KA00251]